MHGAVAPEGGTLVRYLVLHLHSLLLLLSPYTHVHFNSLKTVSFYITYSRSLSEGHELELELLDLNSSEQRSDRKSVEVLKH